MRLKFTIIITLLFVALNLIAQSKQPSIKKPIAKSNLGTSQSKTNELPKKQVTPNPKKNNLTGIWRGYFIQKDYNPMSGNFEEDRYKYEVQINNLVNNGLEGVTYSYNYTTTSFYGKASLQGIFNDQTNNIVLKELKMLELKISGLSEACLMTCYLDYVKNGGKEILKGDYTSQNVKNKNPCGDGIVYLEKVPESDFVKEDFLMNKKPTVKPNTVTSTIKKILPKKDLPSTSNKTLPTKPTLGNTKKILPATKPIASDKPKFKPGAEDALVKKENKNAIVKKDISKKIDSITKPKPALITKKEQPIVKTIDTTTKLVPKDLISRTNNLVKTFYVDEGELFIELYDNGQIDNDTVSIYHNGKPVILHGRLSTIPITVKLKVSSEDPIHELVMVADNLGEIPPNTSLMLVTAGKKVYQVFLTSDLQKNAKIIFEYKPSTDNSKQKK